MTRFPLSLYAYTQELWSGFSEGHRGRLVICVALDILSASLMEFYAWLTLLRTPEKQPVWVTGGSDDCLILQRFNSQRLKYTWCSRVWPSKQHSYLCGGDQNNNIALMRSFNKLCLETNSIRSEVTTHREHFLKNKHCLLCIKSVIVQRRSLQQTHPVDRLFYWLLMKTWMVIILYKSVWYVSLSAACVGTWSLSHISSLTEAIESCNQ